MRCLKYIRGLWGREAPVMYRSVAATDDGSLRQQQSDTLCRVRHTGDSKWAEIAVISLLFFWEITPNDSGRWRKKTQKKQTRRLFSSKDDVDAIWQMQQRIQMTQGHGISLYSGTESITTTCVSHIWNIFNSLWHYPDSQIWVGT